MPLFSSGNDGNRSFSSVIKFEGSPDDLVFKAREEDFNTTTRLIVEETHNALLVVNGAAADLFGPGDHTLSVPNIPILRKFISIPTSGVSPFTCKVFYINMVHQMDMLWGTQGAITLEDPLYDIFLHVMLRGSIALSVADPRRMLIKLVGFRDRCQAKDLLEKFRGIISMHVKSCISQIMINGKLSYFIMNANLMEVSEVVKERLDAIFDDYGMKVEFFNIESIEVPEKDYAEVSAAKNRRTGRIIEGYTWQEERQMIIAEKFASNEGTVGAMGGMVGGAMGGLMMGGTISEIARNAMSQDRLPTQKPPKDASGSNPPMGSNAAGTGGNSSVRDILNGKKTETPAASGFSGPAPFDLGPAEAPAAPVTPNAPAEGSKFCPDCGVPVTPKAKFCPECGHRFARTCPNCGRPIEGDPKFCFECGTKLR